MTSKLKFIVAFFLSACLGLCWYPLTVLERMNLQSSQILFFALSTASVFTVPFMAKQVEHWRNRTLQLLIFSLTGGISNVLLHYSLLHGNPVIVVAIFCLAIISALFLDRLARGINLATGEFLIVLCLAMIIATTLLLMGDSLVFEISQLFAVLSGVGFYRLSLLNVSPEKDIPIMSRVAGIFLASTWLVGMLLIFSPHSTTFPKDNAEIYSALYGLIILVPIIASVVCILTSSRSRALLLWATLLLSVNFVGLILYLDVISVNTLWAPLLLLVLAFGLQIGQWKASHETIITHK